MKKFLVIIPLAVVLFFVACKKDTATTTTTTCTTTPTYTTNIKPLLDASCISSGCHNTASKAGGYDLSNYAGAKAAAAKSLTEITSGDMPQSGTKWSTANVQLFNCWISNNTAQ